MNKKITLIWLRIFYVFGSNQRKGSLMQILENKKNREEVFYLKYPFIQNDFIYIKDVANALLKIIKVNKGSIINVCSGKLTSNIDFIKKFKKISKRVIIINDNNKFNHKKKLYGSNKKLKSLGWSQKYSLNKAFREIIN